MANTIDTMTPEELLRGIIDGSLTELVDNAVTSVEAYRLSRMTLLDRVELTEMTTAYIEAFSYSGASYANFPKCTQYRGATFAYMGSLETINLPKAQLLDYASGVFSNDSSLKMIVLPKSTNGMWSYFFQKCSSLEVADLSTTGFSQGYHFLDCSKLEKLILRKTSGVCSLANLTTFNGSPFRSGVGGGTLYVPSALVETYKTATNWSTIYGYGNQFLPIEGSQYEHYYADGTPVE